MPTSSVRTANNKKAATWTAFREFVVGGGIRTTQINQKVISYSDQIDTFVGTFDVFDLEDSPLINILAERFWIVF